MQWPAIPYASWSETSEALHLWCQIVGKYRLAATPWVNHSWHATLYPSPRGWRTGPITVGDRVVEVAFDFIAHALTLETSDGQRESMKLEPMSVAQFSERFHALTERAGVPVRANGRPNELADALPFTEDQQVRPYDAEAVARFHSAVLSVTHVFSEFRTRFLGKVSPVHLFWGSLDLAVTRFSGRTAPLHPGGIPSLPDEVTQEAYSHEVSSAGFWSGAGLGQAAFYSYAYPSPEGFRDATVTPDAAYFDEKLGEFLLPYEAVRTSKTPEALLLSFLESTWQAASRLGDWPQGELTCPPGQLGVPRRVASSASAPKEPTIGKEEGPTRGRYFVTLAGETAEMTFSKAGTHQIIVDHTGVPDALRGRGLGGLLAARLVADARESGLKIIPLCPFFRSQVERHPEWSDLIAG